MLVRGENLKKGMVVGIAPILLVIVVLTLAYNVQTVKATGSFQLFNCPTSQHLFRVAWKPDGSYALLVAGIDGHYGAEVFRFDGNSFLLLLNDTSIIIHDLSWNPDGSYALLIVHYFDFDVLNHMYRLVKYDGTNFSTIGEARPCQMRGIAWKPDGSYALIVGGGWQPGEAIWKYDGVTLTGVYNASTVFMRADWKPDGSYALLIEFFGDTFTFDGTALSKVGEHYDAEDLSWSADGSYALITMWESVESSSYLKVWKFDGTSFFDVTYQTGTGNRLYGISSSVNGTLIVGKSGTVLRYDGSIFVMLTQGVYGDLVDVDWKPDGSSALIIGGNTLLLYTPSELVGDINKDGKVDVMDLAIVGKAYGSTPDAPNWNSAADVTGPSYLVPDGKVDIRDLALIAKHFGETY